MDEASLPSLTANKLLPIRTPLVPHVNEYHVAKGIKTISNPVGRDPQRLRLGLLRQNLGHSAAGINKASFYIRLYRVVTSFG